jgi:2-oxoglutarate dehydrogenase complex dehydrogenase (E1) component-like enzyme
VVLCSGKHYYNLLSQRETLGRKDIALVRIEALCPFPTMELNKELGRFPKARCK